MSFYTIRLTAGQPFTQNTAGTLLLIDSLGAAAGVDVRLTSVGGSDGPTMPNRQVAFRLAESFSAATFTAAVDTTIGVFLSNSDVQLGITAGSGVTIPGGVAITNTPDARIPVDVGGGTITVTATNVGISNDDTKPVPVRQKAGDVYTVRQARQAQLLDLAPVAVGVAVVQVVSDATLQGVRFRNPHATARIALGGAGVTMANAAIVLEPGDGWNETDAPAAAWYAISDTAGAAVMVQGIK